jgi:hypothetical protein
MQYCLMRYALALGIPHTTEHRRYTMINTFLNTIIAAHKATIALKSLNYTTDIENAKNNFMASLEVASTATQNYEPVNANLAGAF